MTLEYEHPIWIKHHYKKDGWFLSQKPKGRLFHSILGKILPTNDDRFRAIVYQKKNNLFCRKAEKLNLQKTFKTVEEAMKFVETYILNGEEQ
jgi:ribosomal protein S2